MFYYSGWWHQQGPPAHWSRTLLLSHSYQWVCTLFSRPWGTFYQEGKGSGVEKSVERTRSQPGAETVVMGHLFCTDRQVTWCCPGRQPQVCTFLCHWPGDGRTLQVAFMVHYDPRIVLEVKEHSALSPVWFPLSDHHCRLHCLSPRGLEF